MGLPPMDFESTASAISPLRLEFYNDFKNSFPIPDFKYFSLFLASDLVLYSSTKIVSNGAYDRVVLSLLLLCSAILLSGLFVNPT